MTHRKRDFVRGYLRSLTTVAQSSVSAPLHILVNMSFQWSDTKDLGSSSSGSGENGDPIGLKRLGGGTFGVVYLHTGVRGLVYLPTPGLIPYHSSLESLKSVAQSMDAKLSGTNTVSFSRFIKHSAPLGMPSSRQSLPSSTHQLTQISGKIFLPHFLPTTPVGHACTG